MLSRQTRVLLGRYALATTALSRFSGERMAKEAGQSVEFHDFRPYQAGDELRYVDWRVYARSGRLYTRLYQAERTIHLHLLLDTSASMAIGHKARFVKLLAQVLSFVALRDSSAQLHLFDGRCSAPLRGQRRIGDAWDFIEGAPPLKGPAYAPVARLKAFALQAHLPAGAGLALVLSDLLDPSPLRPALSALKARGLDAGFVQVLAAEELAPESGQLELIDSESGERLDVGPDEVAAYRQALQQFLARTRSAITRAGFRYALVRAQPLAEAALERLAVSELIKSGMLVRR